MNIIAKSALAFLFIATSAQAQTIYSFELYDTNDPSAGNFIQAAEAQIDVFISTAVPTAMGSSYKLLRSKFDGDSFSIDNLRASLNPVQEFKQDDIVLFFYVGHGLDDPDSAFPMLQISDNKNGKRQFAAQKILDAISSRNPKTLLAIFEACNVDPRLQNMSRGLSSSFDNSKIRNILASPFGIAIAAAKEGQYSFISADGGVFSNRLLDLFRVGSSVKDSGTFIGDVSKKIRVEGSSQLYQEPWVVKLW